MPDFYPRSPCGERRGVGDALQSANAISIHALLAESDSAYSGGQAANISISIHALLAESDVDNVFSL